MSHRRIVTIDGPAGVGKSTVSRMTAVELGFTYLDTGAMYRTVGLYMSEQGVALDDRAGITARIAEVEMELLPATDENSDTRVLLCGRDISGDIRTQEMSMAASQVSSIPAVRSFLTEMQRRYGEKENIVAEGRDMGTVVFPMAAWKFFLDASPEVRARRRFDQLVERGETVDFEKLLAETVERDYKDSHRDIAPLVPAKDAVIISTDAVDAAGVTAQIIRRVFEKKI